MEEKQYMGRWELGCLVFNSLIYKIFSAYPKRFIQCSGSGAWLTAVFTGIVFLVILWIALKIYEPYAEKGLIESVRASCGNFAAGAVSAAAIIYFVFSGVYALRGVCSALKMIAYGESPLWFTALFFVIGAAVVVWCGDKAVRRMHSLSVPGVGIAALTIALLSMRYADVYNIMPILGKGIKSVFGSGISTLFIYADIVIVFFLPKRGGRYSFKKTVMWSAVLAVVINAALITAISLNMPYELAERLNLPIYPLTKTDSVGKFSIRLDAAYLTSLIVSSMLYVSLAASVILKGIKSMSPRLRKVGATAICAALCFTLCGCYDGHEVEEKAYVIAIGIDKGENAAYKYTFQISNPLESGGSMGAEEKADENSDSGGENENKTVNNITVEGDDYYLAENRLESILSKQADMSHIKVIVYSTETAREGALSHSELLMREREIRPGTNLCLAESAQGFLTSVKPTLEESTVRYYELFFRNENIPYAPVTELRSFVGRSSDSAYDAVVPVAGADSLAGMGVFADGVLKGELNEKDVMLYKMLCGDVHRAAIGNRDASTVVSSAGRPKIEVNMLGDTPEVRMTVRLKQNLIYGGSGDFASGLETEAAELMERVYSNGCDILGIGKKFKKNYLTQADWESFEWDKKLQNIRFYVKIITEKGNSSEILQ